MKRKTVEQIRKEIASRDREILRLLNQRSSLAQEMGRIKGRLGKEVYDPSQEARILSSLADFNEGPLPDEALNNIYREIFSSSRMLQSPPTVACLGPEASFSHLAALARFGRSSPIVLEKTIGQVFDQLEKGKVSFGLVPFENSLEGSVKMTLDRMISTPLKVRAEVFLRVSHCLMSRGQGTEIKKVYSHPQALAQCREWLARNLPHAEAVATDSTATAALRVREDPDGAAIASSLAAKVYGLNLLAEGIEDHPMNITRFLVLGNGESRPTGRDKTSILFGTPHVPGALHGTLGPFAKAGINLLRIESYPLRERVWEYLFFADFGGHLQDKKVRDCLRKVEKKTVFLKVLGSYPKGDDSR
jgi:chorismate mutase/prephenate dehydratase